jgi:hypothetical protein
MSIALPALAVAFGAFFIWITVWVVNRREYWDACWRVLSRSFMRTLPWGTALAVIVVSVLWFVVGPRYRAGAVVQIRGPMRTSPSFFGRREDYDERIESAVKRFHSRDVISKAIESDGLRALAELHSPSAAKDPVQWINQNLAVTRIGKGDICEVSFTARDPESACKVVDGVLSSYLNWLFEEGDRERRMALQVAVDDLANSTKTVERLCERLAAERSENGEPIELPAELEQLRRELQFAEGIHRGVADYVVTLNSASRGEPTVVIPLRSARTPAFPEELTPGQQTAVAGTVTFFIPFLLDVLWTAIGPVRMARRRRGVEE